MRPKIQARRECRPVHVVADEVEARVADVPFVVEHAVGVDVWAHARPGVDCDQVHVVGGAVVEVARELRVDVVLRIGRDRQLGVTKRRNDRLRGLPSRELVHAQECHVALGHTVVVEFDEHGHVELCGHHHEAPQAPEQRDDHQHKGPQPLPQQRAPRRHHYHTCMARLTENKSFCEVPKYVINTRPDCSKLTNFTCYTHAQSCIAILIVV